MSSDASDLFDTPSGDDASDLDISGANMFTEEIENIDASDWNSDLLWGDAGAETAIEIGDGGFDTDFPI